MKNLTSIINALFSRMPMPHLIKDLEMINGGSSPYYNVVLFTHTGIRYRVNGNLDVEEIDGSLLVTNSNTRLVESILKGETTLAEFNKKQASEKKKQAYKNAVSDILNSSTNDITEALIGIGRPDEGTPEELRAELKAWLLDTSINLSDKTETIWLFFGHEKSSAFYEAS